MAGIVCVTEFCTADSGVFASYIDYIDRDNATRKHNLKKYDVFHNYLEYMDNEEKTIKNEMEKGLEKVSSLFTRNQDILSMEDKKNIKKQFQMAQNNKSNMWQTVISFDNKYLEELGLYDSSSHTLNEPKMIRASRKAIDSMLEKEGLENAVWSASFHYNTDNIHIHIATVEPIPMREKKLYRQWQKNEDGKFKTIKDEKTGKEKKIPILDSLGNQVKVEEFKGVFKNGSIKELKRVLASELSADKELNIKLTEILRGIVSDKKENKLLDVPEFKEQLLDLYDELKASGEKRNNWYYNRNKIAYLKPKIKLLSDLFIETYHRDDFADLLAEMQSVEDIYMRVYGGTNNFLKNKLYDNKIGLYSRLGNAILKELQAYDKGRMEQIKAVKRATSLLNDKRSAKEGVDILKSQSEQGNTFAQNKIAMLYLKGEVVDRDVKKAEDYFKRSAKSGNTFAKKMLSNINEKYLYGFGDNSHCERDLRIAAAHLKRSLKNNYESWRNMQEYEKLQNEIERGIYNLEY